MKHQRLKQTAFGFCVVLSLFASSIAACICHDSAKTENHCEPQIVENHSHEASAESHSHEAENSHHEAEQKPLHDTNSTENFSIGMSLEECCCVQSAPKVFAKSETVKIEKQTADYQPNAPPRVDLIVAVREIKAVHFPKPFYLSDSFYNIKSPRAPPRS